MPENNAYEALGRKALELDTLNANYDALLVLLDSVAGGLIKPEWLRVDLKTRTWAWEAPQPEAEPAAAASD